MPPTHEVLNQPPALAGYDVADDPAMLSALRREGAAWAEPAIRQLAGWQAQRRRNGRAARRTRTRRCFARMTALATASTRWNSIRPGTS